MPTNVALTGLSKDLAARAETGKPIRIGLVGAGEMGTDIVSRVAHMTGIEIGAISELKAGAAAKSVEIAYGSADRVKEVASADAANEAIEEGLIAVTDNVDALLEAGLIDVVVDATGVPAVGAEIGLRAMERGKHLVMMNVEADVTIGAYLRAEAEPELLRHQLIEALAGSFPADGAVTAQLEHLEAFKPGQPTPTHDRPTRPAPRKTAGRRALPARS